jgi:hypothetical protein
VSTGERDPRAIRRPLTPETAEDHGGLRLTRHQLEHLRTRLQVQPPGPDTNNGIAEMMERGKRLQGIPGDVLFTLEAIRLLAEQGNAVAAELYQSERIKLGIDRPSFHFGK